jgi:hypothetical protein
LWEVSEKFLHYFNLKPIPIKYQAIKKSGRNSITIKVAVVVVVVVVGVLVIVVVVNM